MINWIKTSPLFCLLLSTGLLLTIVGIGGKNNIYAQQEYDPVKAPVLSVVFTAMSEGIYPWQLLEDEAVLGASSGDLQTEHQEEGDVMTTPDAAQSPVPEAAKVPEQENGAETAEEAAAEANTEASENFEASVQTQQEKDTGSAAAPSPEQALPTATPFQPIEPIRETTQEEYLNHISADIYGDAGVLRAAEYEFLSVDTDWFADALFIGDSRTVGLRDYTDLSEYADFYSETSLTIYKVMESEFGNKGTVLQALEEKDYGKLYIMVGINELGRGTTEDFLSKYAEVIEALHQAEPQAVIYIQGIMRVSGDKSSQDSIYNNDNINARNNAIATLADNRQIFYIDVNEAVCDEQGNLNSEYTHDQIHLLGMYNELWKEFLMTKGVELPVNN